MTSAHQDPGLPDPDRLTNLEVKLTFIEDLVDQLNEVLTRQQQQLELLVREVMRLRQEAAAGERDGDAGMRNLRDELPPHY